MQRAYQRYKRHAVPMFRDTAISSRSMCCLQSVAKSSRRCMRELHCQGRSVKLLSILQLIQPPVFSSIFRNRMRYGDSNQLLRVQPTSSVVASLLRALLSCRTGAPPTPSGQYWKRMFAAIAGQSCLPTILELQLQPPARTFVLHLGTFALLLSEPMQPGTHRAKTWDLL